MSLIDVHTHVVPDNFPSDPSPGQKSRWPCMCMHGNDKGVVEIAGKAFRELDSRSWNINRRIEDMDRDDVSAQALSPMPELLSYWFNAKDGLEMARHVNSVIATMRSAAPDRFYGLGMVPLQDPAIATRELERLKHDGLSGVEIGSNINGTILSDNRFEEFYAEAERLEMALFVHALHPIGVERLGEFPDLIPFAAFPLDTGLSAIAMIRAGIPARYPRLRIGFSHGGGAVVPLAHRLGQGWRLSEGYGGTLPHAPAEYAAKFFYDSLVYDTGYLQYLSMTFAPGQVFAGTDYPYVIEQKGLADFLHECDATVHDSLFSGAGNKFLGVTAA